MSTGHIAQIQDNFDYRQNIKIIKKVFIEYDPKDISVFLFTLSLWLPNIAAPVQICWLTGVFLSFKEDEFKRQKNIKNHKEFETLFNKIKDHIPSFITLEDYIPEPDWGDMQYFLNKKYFKFFYGGELSNAYDFLVLFENLHIPYSSEYKKLIGRNPEKELLVSLELQHDLIESITPCFSNIDQIKLANLEAPVESFYKECSQYLKKFNFKKESLPSDYYLKFGCISESELNGEEFINKIYDGKNLLGYFIEIDSKLFPVLPRRFNAVLMEHWANLARNSEENLIKETNEKNFRLQAQMSIATFAEKMFKKNQVVKLVSALNSDKSPKDVIFNVALIYQDQIKLVFIPDNFFNPETLSEDFLGKKKEIEDSIQLLTVKEPNLGLRFQGKGLVLKGAEEMMAKVSLLTIYPLADAQNHFIELPKEWQGDFMSLHDYLSIIDECKGIEELFKFLEFYSEYKDQVLPIASMLDIFQTFKLSNSVLVEGAKSPDTIFLDPSIGSNQRYENLCKFWKCFPHDPLLELPRSWEVDSKDNLTTFLRRKINDDKLLTCRIDKAQIFLISPLELMPEQQYKLTTQLIMLIDDYLSHHREWMVSNSIFLEQIDLNINIFPLSLIRTDPRFSHLNHLIDFEGLFSVDTVKINEIRKCIRIVFNDEKVHKELIDIKDRHVEVSLVNLILEQIELHLNKPKLSKLIKLLDALKDTKPRFGYYVEKKYAAFPDNIDPNEPESSDYKKARKRIAELARDAGIETKEYKTDEAKQILNKLKSLVVDEINAYVKQFSISELENLITWTDALTNKYEQDKRSIEHSTQNDVDFDLATDLSEKHGAYTGQIKNYCYLIEKFIQLQPNGEVKLSDQKFHFIIALIDWMMVLQTASDAIHFLQDPAPQGVIVHDDFLPEVIYTDEFQRMQDEYGREYHEVELGLRGDKTLEVESNLTDQARQELLDQAFMNDFGFKYSDLNVVLYGLSHWPNFSDGQTNTFYESTADEVIKALAKGIKDLDKEVIPLILDYLTLKPSLLLKIEGVDLQASDLPIWEHNKRFQRYSIRPILERESKLVWGSFSTKKAMDIWSGNARYGMLPINIQTETVSKVRDTIKKSIETSLVEKANDLVRTYTQFFEKDLYLHKRFPKQDFPDNLGDYDILCYLPQKNVVLCIESSDVKPAFCMKDNLTLRNALFGTETKPSRHIKKMLERDEYMNQNLEKVFNSIGWKMIDPSNPPRVLPVYLSRIGYWFTKYPPYKTNINFIQIVLLKEFIDSLPDIL